MSLSIKLRNNDSNKNFGVRQTVFQFRLHYSYLFILALLGLHCCAGFSLFSESGGYSLLVLHGLFIVVASLVVEHGL